MQGISTLFMVLPSHPDVVQWGRNIIEAAKDAGVKHIVRSSGSLAKLDSSLMVVELLNATDQDLRDSGKESQYVLVSLVAFSIAFLIAIRTSNRSYHGVLALAWLFVCFAWGIGALDEPILAP